jgi:hypothetical protein
MSFMDIEVGSFSKTPQMYYSSPNRIKLIIIIDSICTTY